MKDKITVTKKNDKINFFLNARAGKFFLFSQNFSKGVYSFFQNGKSETEIKSFRKWNRNPRLDKTIEKIPLYTKYVRKEIIGVKF